MLVPKAQKFEPNYHNHCYQSKIQIFLYLLQAHFSYRQCRLHQHSLHHCSLDKIIPEVLLVVRDKHLLGQTSCFYPCLVFGKIEILTSGLRYSMLYFGHTVPHHCYCPSHFPGLTFSLWWSFHVLFLTTFAFYFLILSLLFLILFCQYLFFIFCQYNYVDNLQIPGPLLQ